MNVNALLGLGYLAQDVLGPSTCVSGLACIATAPPSLAVQIGVGRIYSLAAVDATSYSTLGTNATVITKQGVLAAPVTLNCPAPITSGFSINYLIEAQYLETDTGSTVLPYYNSANPQSPLSGAGNLGIAQPTLRSGQCSMAVKAGTPATTGTQTTPAPDSGFVGLWVVTVANGATTITSGNIAQAAEAPFLTALLTSVLTQPIADLRYLLQPTQTLAEVASSVVPVSTRYPEGHVLRYGTNTTPGVTDMTAAINAALRVSGFGGAEAYIPAGVFGVMSDLNFPMGVKYLQGGSGPFGASLRGAGKLQTEIRFISGGTITNGVYFNGGSTYELGGTIRDLMINGNGVAPKCLTISFGDTVTARDLIVRGSTGQGIFVDNSIMTRLEQILVGGNGSASAAQVEIDGTLVGSTGGTTTTVMEQVYITGANVGCVCGLKVDRSNNTTIVGGAIESTGQIGLAVSSKGGGTETHACAGFSLIGVDFENLTDHYIQIGYGLANTAFVTGFTASNCTGQGSSAPATPYAVKLNFSNGARFTNCAWGQPGSPTCTYWIEGNNGLRTTLDEHAATFGIGYPWVMRNGAWLKSATPLVKFNSHESPCEAFRAAKAVSGTSWSVLVDTSQGGWFEQLSANNGSATNVTTLTDGATGMRVYIKGDGQSTLKQGTGTNNFNNAGADDLLLVSGQYYCYMFNGTYWDQVGT